MLHVVICLCSFALVSFLAKQLPFFVPRIFSLSDALNKFRNVRETEQERQDFRMADRYSYCSNDKEVNCASPPSHSCPRNNEADYFQESDFFHRLRKQNHPLVNHPLLRLIPLVPCSWQVPSVLPQRPFNTQNQCNVCLLTLICCSFSLFFKAYSFRCYSW